MQYCAFKGLRNNFAISPDLISSAFPPCFNNWASSESSELCTANNSVSVEQMKKRRIKKDCTNKINI